MSEVEREIRKLEEELTQTEMRLDVDALERIYADDIMVTAPIGICVDKPAVMAEGRQASDKAKIERDDKDDLKGRAYGDTAGRRCRRNSQNTILGGESQKYVFAS